MTLKALIFLLGEDLVGVLYVEDIGCREYAHTTRE